MTPTDTRERIKELFTLFKLPTMAAECVRRFSDAGHDDALEVLAETLEAELGERRVRRCDRLLRASKLPPAKTFETLDPKRLPKGISPRLHELASSDVLERAVNILCFGLPGTNRGPVSPPLRMPAIVSRRSPPFTFFAWSEWPL